MVDDTAEEDAPVEEDDAQFDRAKQEYHDEVGSEYKLPKLANSLPHANWASLKGHTVIAFFSFEATRSAPVLGSMAVCPPNLPM